MRQPFIILLLWLLITPLASSNYTVQMTVILASIDVSAFAPLQIAFRRAVATTAQVDISAVSVNSYSNHVAPSSFRRLLSFRHLLSTSTEVSFFIQTTDYQTASAIGIRLQPVYMTEDLTSEGLPPATILSGPLFLGHDANLLTCVGWLWWASRWHLGLQDTDGVDVTVDSTSRRTKTLQATKPRPFF